THTRPGAVACPCPPPPGPAPPPPPRRRPPRRGVADSNGRAKLPEPTDALPGTPEKVRVLEERARLGQALWHPLDAKLDLRKLAELEVDREVEARVLCLAS